MICSIVFETLKCLNYADGGKVEFDSVSRHNDRMMSKVAQ